jgi:hypothetical protein
MPSERASLAHPRAPLGASSPALALPHVRASTDGARRNDRPLSSPVSAMRERQQQQANHLAATAPPPPPAVGTQATDAELARILEGAPPISVTLSPTKSFASLSGPEGGGLSRSNQPQGWRKQFAYTRKGDEKAKVILSKDTMELELTQMRSFNRQVYETRVRQNFLEEQVTRKLYTQKLSMMRHEQLSREKVRQEERIAKEFALGTPYLQLKAKTLEWEALQEADKAHAAPHFADLAAIEQKLARADLMSRGVGSDGGGGGADGFGKKPISVKQLAQRAGKEIPPNHSLMNPRNQVTSPLPPKELLMPRMPDTSESVGAGGRGSNPLEGSAAKALVGLVPELLDAKRTADYDAERRGKPRPSLPVAVRAHLLRTCPSAEGVTEKLAALRFACSAHAAIPRVAIFRGMMGWDREGVPWDNTKSAACLLLLVWLQPPADDATKVSRRFVGKEAAKALLEDDVGLELRISDVEEILKHLQRKRLVSQKGASVLAAEARALELPATEGGEASRDAPSVDVDELLLRWMRVWGSWESNDERELLRSVVGRFKPQTPRSKSAAAWAKAA